MIEKILLGTYTKKSSQGIYSIELDTDKEALTCLTHIAKEDNPTYLAKSQKNVLYSVSKEGENGGVAAYNLTEQAADLLDRVTSPGAPPCYVAVDEARQLLYSANYHKGQISSYKIKESGDIQLVDTATHSGNGPHPNQKSAHAHYADLTPDKRLVACDLGTDKVYTYDVSADGKLTEVAVYQAMPGTGPRHLVFHPTEAIAYLLGELASTITVLAYETTTGVFTPLQTLSSLPADTTIASAGGAIRISQDGKFLYASNRGHNSIAVYALSNEGKQAEAIQFIDTEGDFPRDFALNSNDDFLVVGHQESDNLTLFARDANSGRLELKQKDVFAPECVCLLF